MTSSHIDQDLLVEIGYWAVCPVCGNFHPRSARFWFFFSELEELITHIISKPIVCHACQDKAATIALGWSVDDATL
jgi:hypothetical protein